MSCGHALFCCLRCLCRSCRRLRSFDSKKQDQKIAAFGSSYRGRFSRVSRRARGGASWLRLKTWMAILSSRPFSALAMACSQRSSRRPWSQSCAFSPIGNRASSCSSAMRVCAAIMAIERSRRTPLLWVISPATRTAADIATAMIASATSTSIRVNPLSRERVGITGPKLKLSPRP